MKHRHLLAAGLFALAGFISAQAATVTVLPDGGWNVFDVSDVGSSAGDLNWYDVNDGSALGFSFSIGDGQVGTLTVVDAVFSGDVFSVSANGTLLGTTSAAVNSFPAGSNVGYDFDLALADINYSRGIFKLGAGIYTVTGSLLSSALDELGAPLNATAGGLKLEVSAVPEPSTLAVVLAGLGLAGAYTRRRAHSA